MGIWYENRTKFCAIRKTNHLGFAAHLHKEVEVVYMLKGKSKAYIDSKEYVLEAGDLFISFPNKVHYFDTFMEDEESFLLIFSPDVITDFTSILLKNDPLNPLVKKNELPENIGSIFYNAYTSNLKSEKFKLEKLKGYVNIFLAEIIPCLKFREATNNHTEMLSSVLSYCVEHYKDNISLDEMAKELHASKYYISRLFSEKIKISFNDYINMLRINDAKESLVKTNDSVTEIGINVGYNTIRSFNRAFLSQTGMQPREYRNSYRSMDNDTMEATEKKSKKVITENDIANISSDFECCF